MDSRTIVLKGWKITEEDYYKLIDINTDYADYAYCPCWGDTDGIVFIGDKICALDQGYYMEMDDTNKLIFSDDLILTNGITDSLSDINSEFIIDCANIGISQDQEVFGPPKTYLIHLIFI